MRTGPCTGCGKTIDWEHDLCPECERTELLREEVLQARRRVIQHEVSYRNAQGWRTNGEEDTFICPKCIHAYDTKWTRPIQPSDLSIVHDIDMSVELQFVCIECCFPTTPIYFAAFQEEEEINE